nr:hypothetical protein [Tanacetum cinerariifolium]
KRPLYREQKNKNPPLAADHPKQTPFVSFNQQNKRTHVAVNITTRTLGGGSVVLVVTVVVDGSGVIGGVCGVGDDGDGDNGSVGIDSGGVVGRVGESDIWDRIDRLVGEKMSNGEVVVVFGGCHSDVMMLMAAAEVDMTNRDGYRGGDGGDVGNGRRWWRVAAVAAVDGSGCHGGGEWRCMASVVGGSCRSGWKEYFWGSSEKGFRRGGRRQPAGGLWRLPEIDRETGNNFGVRRKNFPVAATGGEWPEVVAGRQWGGSHIHHATPPTAVASHKSTTTAGTTATATAFPAAVAAVVGCGWRIGHHRRGGA